jgi:serine/threonine protein kinase
LLKGNDLNHLILVLKKGFDVSKNHAWLNDSHFVDILTQMFSFDPVKRISPEALLSHEFMITNQCDSPHSLT